MTNKSRAEGKHRSIDTTRSQIIVRDYRDIGCFSLVRSLSSAGRNDWVELHLPKSMQESPRNVPPTTWRPDGGQGLDPRQLENSGAFATSAYISPLFSAFLSNIWSVRRLKLQTHRVWSLLQISIINGDPDSRFVSGNSLSAVFILDCRFGKLWM